MRLGVRALLLVLLAGAPAAALQFDDLPQAEIFALDLSREADPTSDDSYLDSVECTIALSRPPSAVCRCIIPSVSSQPITLNSLWLRCFFFSLLHGSRGLSH
jgi:hypothetical protein